MQSLSARTIKNKISAIDKGVKSNQEIKITLIPSSPGIGIRFIRTDVEGDNILKLSPENIDQTKHLNTSISNGNTSVMFIEHLVSALWILNIKNIDIELNGEEVPLFDGSASYFISMIKCAGIQEQEDKYKLLKLKKIIKVEKNQDTESYIIAKPSDTFKITYNIDYKINTIKKEPFSFDISVDNFINDIASARTFCLQEEDKTRRDIFSVGWNDFNNVKFSNDSVSSSENILRYKNEAARHKILDAIGDIGIMGFKIEAELDCYKSGHNLNHSLVRKILSDRENYTLE